MFLFQQIVFDIESSLASLPDIVYEHSVTGFGMFPPPKPLSDNDEDGVGIDITAERRREMKKQNFPQKDRIKKSSLFGFNKIAVCLSTRFFKTILMNI